MLQRCPAAARQVTIAAQRRGGQAAERRSGKSWTSDHLRSGRCSGTLHRMKRLALILLCFACTKAAPAAPPATPSLAAVAAPAQDLARPPRFIPPDIETARIFALTANWSMGVGRAEALNILTGALEHLGTRAVDVERVLRRRILKGDGTIADPVGAFRDLFRIAIRQNGGSRAGARAGMMREFGPAAGNLIAGTDFDDVERVAARLLVEGVHQVAE